MSREEKIQQEANYHYTPDSAHNCIFVAGAKRANETLLEKLKEFVGHHTDIKDVYKFIETMKL